MPINKTFRLRDDLLVINGLSLLLIGVILLTQAGVLWLQPVRVVLGLPFVLFFPGYALIGALFPAHHSLDGLERVALSFGLSLAVVPLIGLGLNYTPWGIRLIPILVSLVVFTFLMSLVAFFRRRNLSDEAVFYPVVTFNLPGWSEMGRTDRVLSVVLVLAVIFAVGSIVYVVTMPKTGEKFTEFYILGPTGKAADYPRDLAPGQSGSVIVGVVNHEYAPVNYYVEIEAGGFVKERTGLFQLTDGQKWEKTMSFAVQTPRKDLEVEFLLFRQGDVTAYRSLHLWVDVGVPASVPVKTPVKVTALPPATRKTVAVKRPSTRRAVYR